MSIDESLSGQVPTTPEDQRSRWLKVFTRLIIGTALIAFLVFKVDYTGSWRTLISGDFTLCAAAFLLFGCSRFAEGLRLYFLLPHSSVSLRKAVEIVFISTFFNNFGAMIAGDGYRVISLWNQIKDLQKAIVVTVVDRFLGVFAIVALGAVYIPFFGQGLATAFEDITVRAPSRWMIFGGIAVGICIVAGAIYLGVFHREKLRENISHIRSVIVEVGPRDWFFASSSSLAAQLAMTGMIFTLILAFGESISFPDTMLVMLIVFFASYVPISVGALGVREGAIVLGLAAFSVDKPVALSVALVSRIMIYQYAIGAGMWFFLKRSKDEMKLPKRGSTFTEENSSS